MRMTTYAPFVNAEKPQYLVIEDSFPNGRPALEKGFGVYMADRNTAVSYTHLDVYKRQSVFWLSRHSQML